jgi:hypothetical protein
MRGTWRIRQWLRKAAKLRARRDAIRAVNAFPLQTDARPHELPFQLTVSLTSYPPRFGTLSLTLRSLLDQSVRADRTVLWIAHNDFAALPSDVHDLVSHGLHIMQCDDLRSFKKLVPALGAYPGSAIVTADDDVYYPADWLETLVNAANEAPGHIAAHRAHRAKFTPDGHFAPYADWEKAVTDRTGGLHDHLLFPTGDGGIFYPPDSLDSRVTDASLFMELCPMADDLWFFWMAKLRGTGHRGVGIRSEFITWKGTDENSLYHHNWHGNENDRQIAALEGHFGALRHNLIAVAAKPCNYGLSA